MLSIREDGQVVGSVSGGCIEDDLIDRVRRRGIEQTLPEVVKYGITADEAHRFGLPCGGTIELVLEPLVKASGIGSLCSAIENGEIVSRTLNLLTGNVTIRPALAIDGIFLSEDTLTTVHGPRYRMLVIGAGQLSKYLCSIAVGLDYQVTVCDPREDYIEEWNVAGTKLVRTMPDDTVIEMRLDERCAVIALTHDPKLDDLALMEALQTPAFYVGALGSRRNNSARHKRLGEFDLSPAQIERMYGPAGIYIASRSPPEIAISILAEITAVKNGVKLAENMRVEQAKEVLGATRMAASSCLA